MLKWIVILLKALTIVPAVVSMKKSEVRIAFLRRKTTAEMDNASFARNDASRWKSDYDIATDTVDRQNNLISSNWKKQDSPDTCTCRGCRVLRGLTHGYADRMRGAIRRDIEADSA